MIARASRRATAAIKRRHLRVGLGLLYDFIRIVASRCGQGGQKASGPGLAGPGWELCMQMSVAAAPPVADQPGRLWPEGFGCDASRFLSLTQSHRSLSSQVKIDEFGFERLQRGMEARAEGVSAVMPDSPNLKEVQIEDGSEEMNQSSGLTLASVIRVKRQARVIKNRVEYKKASETVLYPNGKAKVSWDFFNLLLLIYSTFEIPFDLAFSNNNCNVTDQELANLAIDCVFLCDLVLNFFTAYMDEETGILQVFKTKIALHYLKTWMVFDLVSSLPWDRIFCLITNFNSAQVVRVFRMIKILRFVRMIRIAGRLQELIGSWAKGRLLMFCASHPR